MKATEKSKKIYTTHEVANLLGVTPITVIRWIDSGKFKCFTTVGGHRRIEHNELVHFAELYNLPWRGDEEVRQRKEWVILGVDDEEDVLEMMGDMFLSCENIRFIAVTNAFTAGAKLVEERPDMILLDFKMPELDGFEFCRFMREDPRFRDVPILAVTGLTEAEDITRMKNAGVNEVLHKPFSQAELLSKIEKFRRFKQSGGPEAKAA